MCVLGRKVSPSIEVGAGNRQVAWEFCRHTQPSGNSDIGPSVFSAECVLIEDDLEEMKVVFWGGDLLLCPVHSVQQTRSSRNV